MHPTSRSSASCPANCPCAASAARPQSPPAPTGESATTQAATHCPSRFLRAARTALRLLHCASDKTFVIYLISGGGSTLFDLPLDPDISLADTIAFHEALIASGATIAEINTLRKHFSAVKGGRLATAAPQAVKLTLQVVDVPWQHADAVASGPTLADPSTIEDCRKLLGRYGLLEKFPPSVRRFFTQSNLPETPGDKAALKQNAEQAEQARKAGPGQYAWSSFSGGSGVLLTNWLATLLSESDLLRAAQEKAASLGYEDRRGQRL